MHSITPIQGSMKQKQLLHVAQHITITCWGLEEVGAASSNYGKTYIMMDRTGPGNEAQTLGM